MSLRNPVKYPVKYYSWQDANAPQLSNADGVIKTILKACLVTGYDSKAGAGWTALFEDAYRIVLRRPLRTGNPPDIKIENGTITGTTVRHRIVSQDNPTGLDDATELSAVNLLARDSRAGNEWYCIVTDFAFLLCYQMGLSSSSTNKNTMLFVGGMTKTLDTDFDRFFCTTQSYYTQAGTTTSQMQFLSTTCAFKEMRQNTDYTVKNFIALNLAEKYFNNDYFAQKIMLDSIAIMPFFCGVTSQSDSNASSVVSIDNRQMLRFANLAPSSSSAIPRAFYIPLDYWEL